MRKDRVVVRRELLFLALGGLSALGFVPAALAQDTAPRYAIQARIDTRARRIEAHQQVRFTNNGPAELKELYFHIYPNRVYTPQEKDFIQRFAGYFKVNPFPGGFPERDFHLGPVTSNGKTLTTAVEGQDETLLRVDLPAALKPGETVEVALDFTVGIPRQAFGRFGWHENIMQLSRWYPILSVVVDGEWNKNPFYPFHRPFYSEASDYSVELTIPEREVVASSGDWAGERRNADGTKTHVYLTTNPIREFSCAMSPDYQVESEESNGVRISSYYLPGDQQRARDAITHARDLMQFYTRRFGPYPYDHFSIAPVYLGYGGEQMSNLIFINVYAYRLPGFLGRYFDFLVAHETGHQWFYNTVGINEYTQMWLEEGVNSYFIEQYLKHKYGPNGSVLEYPRWAKSWAARLLPDLTFHRTRDFRYKMIARTGFDHAIIDKLASFSEPSSIFSVTYGKGARVLGMLNSYLGEETFGRVFARVVGEYQFRNLDIKDFIRICEEESGKDLAWFFDQWLYKPGSLDYAAGQVRGNRVTLYNRGVVTSPATVEVELSDGTKQRLTWDGQKKSEEIVVDGAPVKRVTIDPDHVLLDIDRVNNSSPRLVHLKLVPLYLGLYDIPLFLPEDGYNLVAGPELAKSGVGLKAAFHQPYDQSVYAGTDYEFGESIWHSRLGYRIKNVFHSLTTAGVEVANRTDYDGGEEDLVSGKLFLRRELWPAQYGLTDINDHVTLYLARNVTPSKSSDLLTGGEDGRNITYGRRNESIVGTNFHLNRSGPYPDPHQGYQLNTVAESAGHFLNATQYFYRSSADLSFYQPVTPATTLGLRAKYGWGYPDDKNLFQLGGMDGLRGYDRKTVRGAQGFLGSVEYRFPVVRQCRVTMLDNIFSLESVGGVAFVDAGQAWYDDIHDSRLRKDAGVGLRFTVNIGSFLEKVIVRADIAQAINDSSEDPRFWFGLNQAF